MALITALFVSQSLAGEPQCATALGSCYYSSSFEGPGFGDAFHAFYNRGGSYVRDSEVPHLCSKQNWVKKELCHSHCPLRLIVTEPAELAMTVCVFDNIFEPYDPEGHLDAFHPLNGRELTFELPGGPSGLETGCFPEDYSSRDFSGKMAIIPRGGCTFQDKFVSAKGASALAGLMVNNDVTANSILGQRITMIGDSRTFPAFPAASIPKQHGDLIVSALRANTTVKGKYELNCSPLPNPEEYWTDGCPDMRLRGVCSSETLAEEDQLCQRCPFFLGEEEGNGVCLYSNQLFPRSKATTFAGVAMPMALKMYFMMDDSLGCAVTDFEGATGRIVFFYQPLYCLTYAAVLNAQKAGAAAVVLVVYGSRQTVEGPSLGVNIPVHLIHKDDYGAFYDGVVRPAIATGTYLRLNGRLNGATGAPDWVMTIVVGGPVLNTTVVDSTTAPVPLIASPSSISTRPSWEWSPAVCVCLSLCFVLLLLLGAVFRNQRKNAIELPSEDGESQAFAVPLGVASMSLSLSLLLTIATVAFVLAFSAGQESTDTALQNGRDAAQQTYENAFQNVETVAKDMRKALVGKVVTGVLLAIGQGEAINRVTVSMYEDMDGSWAEFDARTKTFFNFANREYGKGWLPQVFSRYEYFISRKLKTDDRSNAERNDGIANPVGAERNFGSAYGTLEYRFVSGTPVANSVVSRYRANPWNMLGGAPGKLSDVIASSQPEWSYVWHLTDMSSPQVEDDFRLPLSVFTTIWDPVQTNLGYVEARTQLSTFAAIVTSAFEDGGKVENMTLVLYDRSKLHVIATNVLTSSERMLVGQIYDGVYTDMYKVYKVYDLPSVELVAYYNHVQGNISQPDGDERDFEQRSSYVQPPMNIVKIVAQDGAAVDVSGSAWDVELRGGSYEVDPVTGVDLFRFNGNTILFMYLNMTTDYHLVESARVRDPEKGTDGNATNGNYASSLDIFSETKHLGNGKWCVSSNEYAATGGTPVDVHCLYRENFFRKSYTFSIRVKSDVLVNDTAVSSATPVLVSDTPVGETNFRLFANGILTLNVISFGCRTEKFADGLPAGEWTHITAVVDARLWYCAVYLNGKLHSRGEITVEYGRMTLSTPVEVGRGFVGVMENAQFYNTSFSEEEVALYHRRGTFERNVAERRWLAVTDVISTNRYTYGINWAVTGLLPYDDIYREVDENNRVTMTNLQVEEDNTQKELRQRSNETILVIIVIALASVLIFLVFNDVLTKPFAQCAVTMTDAAVMNIEEIPQQHSYIRELNAMNRATTLMMRNLKEYKSYMPQSLQINTTDDDETEAPMKSDGGASLASTLNNRHGGRASRYSIGSRTQLSSGNTSGSARQEAVSFHAALAGEKRKIMGVSLSSRKISYCVINVRNFHSKVWKMSDRDLLGIHGQILSIALSAFVASKGIAEVFSGDRFACSFNAAKAIGAHRSAAAQACVIIKDKVKDELDINVSAAAVSGEARVGNMGNEVMKRFSFISPVVTWAHALERYTRSLTSNVTADYYVAEEVRGAYYTRSLGTVLFEKRHQTKPIKVYDIPSIRSAGAGDEWMYQLEAQERSDPYKRWGTWVGALMDEDWPV